MSGAVLEAGEIRGNEIVLESKNASLAKGRLCPAGLRAQSSRWASGIHTKRKFIIYLISKKKEINHQSKTTLWTL